MESKFNNFAREWRMRAEMNLHSLKAETPFVAKIWGFTRQNLSNVIPLKHYFFSIIIFVSVLALILVPFVNAETLSIENLQQRIQRLLHDVRILQAQLEIAEWAEVAEESGHNESTKSTTDLNDEILDRLKKNTFVFDRTLKKGNVGEDVKKLQTFLATNNTIYPEQLVTGYFGILTERAVKRFQFTYNIINIGAGDTLGYGSVGPKTIAKMNTIIVNSGKLSVSEARNESTQTFNADVFLSGELDSDMDGMPDLYEIEHGYDPHKNEEKLAEDIDITECRTLEAEYANAAHHTVDHRAPHYCIIKKAKANDNVFLCDKISVNRRERAICYAGFANSRKAPALCKQTYDAITRPDCYSDMAILLNDESYCGQMTDVTYDDLALDGLVRFSQAMCYNKVAVLRRNGEICDLISEKDGPNHNVVGIKYGCYEDLAVVLKDPTYCAKALALKAYEGYHQATCYHHVALASHSVDYCEHIAEKESVFDDSHESQRVQRTMAHCYKDLALIYKEPAYCDKAQAIASRFGGSIGEYCYMSLAPMLGDAELCKNIPDHPEKSDPNYSGIFTNFKSACIIDVESVANGKLTCKIVEKEIYSHAGSDVYKMFYKTNRCRDVDWL